MTCSRQKGHAVQCCWHEFCSQKYTKRRSLHHVARTACMRATKNRCVLLSFLSNNESWSGHFCFVWQHPHPKLLPQAAVHVTAACAAAAVAAAAPCASPSLACCTHSLPASTPLLVSTSNVHRSSVSWVNVLVITSTSRCSKPCSSHAASAETRNRGIHLTDNLLTHYGEELSALLCSNLASKHSMPMHT